MKKNIQISDNFFFPSSAKKKKKIPYQSVTGPREGNCMI